jgi:EmrB/QacA subfamily drug resistance transporter
MTVAAAPTADEAGDATASHVHPWRAVAVLFFAGFMDLLDVTIVNVALPGIQRDLHSTYASVQWVIAAYLLSYAVVLVPAGRAGDVLGRKRLFVLGVAGFTVASAMCGLAVSPGMLIGARVLQGTMAAVMTPQVMSFVQVLFPPDKRGPVIGAFGGMAGLATVVGPLLGGLLVNADIWGLHWRPVFLINLPVGVFAIVAALRILPESKSDRALRLDWVGTGLIVVGLLLLLYPVVEGREMGWPLWGWLCIAASPVVLAVAARHQLQAARAGESTLVVPSLFTNRGFVGGVLTTVTSFVALNGFFLVFTLHLQIGLGFSALRTGFAGIAFSIATAIAAGVGAGRLAPRFGRPVITAGAIVMAIGMFAIYLTVRATSGDLTPWNLVPAMGITGLGFGAVVAPLFDFALAEVPTDDAGAGSGVLGAVQQLGGAIGVAVIGVVFFNALGPAGSAAAREQAAALQSRVPPVAVQAFVACSKAQAAAKDPTVTPVACRPPAGVPTDNPVLVTLRGAAAKVQHDAFSTAYRHALLADVAAMVVAIGMTLLLPRRRGTGPPVVT